MKKIWNVCRLLIMPFIIVICMGCQGYPSMVEIPDENPNEEPSYVTNGNNNNNDDNNNDNGNNNNPDEDPGYMVTFRGPQNN